MTLANVNQFIKINIAILVYFGFVFVSYFLKYSSTFVQGFIELVTIPALLLVVISLVMSGYNLYRKNNTAQNKKLLALASVITILVTAATFFLK
ncbi:MAG: hypothetical protein Q4G08_04520 [Capnocytophaga sp.]|nr:hypothetical protein [Capnocytophaga sp.]